MNQIIDKLRRERKGAMFIIEGPSGTGKGTIAKQLLDQDKNIKFSVSVTTRAPRHNEVEGVDYYFISNEKYDELLKQDAFYEFVDSQYGSRYGTLRSEVDSFINVGQDVLFDMDWEGARQMRQKAPDDVVTIYLLPPSIKELHERLVNRGTDSKEVIDKRMKLVLDKLSHCEEFDYIVVNAELEDTVKKIQRIISGERMKRVRQTGMKDFVTKLENEAKEILGL
ncbi:MAG: guanylate kinase [Alphaproteobacteria bacterium]|nr:guanylate kinase [Alphaproteobacteria bacterium]